MYVGNAADHVQGIGPAAGRISLAEAERTGSDTIRMTHEQTLQHISSAREAVARMLKGFSEDGLVELRRGAITLRDTGRIESLKMIIWFLPRIRVII